MKSIYSSFFGRFFGNPTSIIIDKAGLTISVQRSVTQVSWQQLTSAPLFNSGLFGHTLVFCTADNHYVLSKLSYNYAAQKKLAEQYWLNTHQGRLQKLLTNIDNFVERRYLRQSAILRMRAAINSEYQRWFPWAAENIDCAKTTQLVQRLADYQQWLPADFSACQHAFIEKQLLNYQTFFDQVESNPLTAMQRRACVIDDDNNLLLAGAGTGKTSVMVGRAGYLLISQQASHEQLLLLAYGKKAAQEMDQRIREKLGTDKISASTFHRLGLDIIAQVEGTKPKLSAFAEDEKSKTQWVQDCFAQLLKQPNYAARVVKYLCLHADVNLHALDFARRGDYYQYLKDNDVRSLNGEQVNSVGALHIANWLFSQGIEYQYASNYQFEACAPNQKQYQPDFFLPAFNIYIEYVERDENGHCAPYIDNSYYQSVLDWQTQTHREHDTQCIEVSLADLQQEKLFKQLSKQLAAHQVNVKAPSTEGILANLEKSGQLSKLAELFSTLIGLYKAACVDKQAKQQLHAAAAQNKQTKLALAILTPIVRAYQKQLGSSNEIDFEDMINKALGYVESGKFNSPWRYIMVDEFQDISVPRARLVKALRNNRAESSVFAVGDDWQAIYRFSGADVSLTTGFADYFGATTQTELDQTFRFNNKIAQVASDFVSKNPAQINKKIRALQRVKKPALSVLRRAIAQSAPKEAVPEVANGALDEVLAAISQRVTKRSRVYLLARNWFQLPDSATMARLRQQYAQLDIECLSFHAAKGKESDFVVLLGLQATKQRFPAQKTTPRILDLFLAKQESFQHAEERRLFYVALTRGKNRVYLITDILASNPFVQELINEHTLELHEFTAPESLNMVEPRYCPRCETGILTAREGRYGAFFSCSYYPRCSHQQKT